MKKELREMIRNSYSEAVYDFARYGDKTDPYFFDACNYMSPIERNVWSDMRMCGLRMFYQYPIGKYFADFANPKYRIVIEVDGKKWHTDVKSDELRQKEIENRGWKVYRIKGRYTYPVESKDEDGYDCYENGKSFELVEELSDEIFENEQYEKDDKEMTSMHEIIPWFIKEQKLRIRVMKNVGKVDVYNMETEIERVKKTIQEIEKDLTNIF